MHFPRLRSLRSRSSNSSKALIDFYAGKGPDHEGRYLSEILKWDAIKLEREHDYIQTLFPLPEASRMGWASPVVDRRVFDAFRSRPELREQLRKSFRKMLWFYGIDIALFDRENLQADDLPENRHNWDTRSNHNHLRITRIIRSLRILGLEEEAQSFYSVLEKAQTMVCYESREYWRRAAERDLNISPSMEVDDEHDNTIGPLFLREYELERKKRMAAEKKDVQKPAVLTEEHAPNPAQSEDKVKDEPTGMSSKAIDDSPKPLDPGEEDENTTTVPTSETTKEETPRSPGSEVESHGSIS